MPNLDELKTLHQNSQFQQALDGYLELIEETPDDAELLYYAAQAQAQLGDLERAQATIERALEVEPETDAFQQFLARIHFDSGRFEEAKTLYQASLNNNPNLFYSYLALADIALLENDFDEAVKQLKLALKVHTDGLPAKLRLIKMDLLRGQLAASIKALEVLRLEHPKDIEVRLLLAIALLEKDADAMAEIHLQHIVDSMPEPPPLARIYLGISKLKSDPKTALALIRAVTEAYPRAPETSVALGMYHYQHNNFTEAAKFLASPSLSHLGYPSWVITYARALEKLGYLNEAENSLKRFLQRAADDRVKRQLAALYRRQQRYKEAIEVYDSVSPEFEHRVNVLTSKGICQYELGEYAQALESLDAALGVADYFSDAVLYKIKAHVALQQWDQALAVCDGIRREDYNPQFVNTVLRSAGLIHDHLGDYAAAYDNFSRIQHQLPPTQPLLEPQRVKAVSQWPNAWAQDGEVAPVFVFSSEATGHGPFSRWLKNHGVLTLTDRFSPNPRHDFLTRGWNFEELDSLTEEQILRLRKRYRMKIREVEIADYDHTVDFVPFNVISAAVIRRVFPEARVLVLVRNVSDIRLHQLIFGHELLSHEQWAPCIHQIRSIGLSLTVVEVEQWLAKNDAFLAKMKQIWPLEFIHHKQTEGGVLDRRLMPTGHAQHYQPFLN